MSALFRYLKRISTILFGKRSMTHDSGLLIVSAAAGYRKRKLCQHGH